MAVGFPDLDSTIIVRLQSKREYITVLCYTTRRTVRQTHPTSSAVSSEPCKQLSTIHLTHPTSSAVRASKTIQRSVGVLPC